MYVVTIARQGPSLFMGYFLYGSNNMYINRMVIGTSIFDIDMKVMSRIIIFETANLSQIGKVNIRIIIILSKNVQYL